MLAGHEMILAGRRHLWSLPCLSPADDRTSPARSPVRILVVDDDERGRRITARMLRDEGYQVIEAPSAEQALERLADAGEIQLVVADIVMPGGMNGVELMEKILGTEPGCRVVLMSGYDTAFPSWDSLGLGVPLLIKPFTAHQLMQQVVEVLKGDLH
jgi:DNA-binding NtrC family response regulator